MVYVQLPITTVSDIETINTYDTTTPFAQNGTTTRGKSIKGVFPVPYFGKYKVRIINNIFYVSSGFTEFVCIKSQVLTNSGSPTGVLAFLASTTIVNYPVPLEFICNINGSIDYEITTLNPNSTAMSFIMTSAQSGTSPNLAANGVTPFKYAILTLELTKIED